MSPAESFAVNMEYFLLDPEFACRRPAVSSYFRQLFGVEDQPQCEPRLMFYTIVEQPGKWMKVDWKKVYGVFLAVADPGGESLLGRWGHASLLIVQCAPHREVVSEECWNDQEHHVFLDYHSNPLGYEFQKDMSISDGLFGRHLAQLHPFTYANRVQYYLEREKRGLTFFELRSEVKSHAEMVRDILYFMFESFLAYRGTWNHLNKNCVTHLHESLQSSLPELQAVTLMPLTTPLELAKRYQEAGVAVPTVRLEPDL